jgi:hypothetical protein
MFGAAKMGDLALQQQLLRCMEAAGLQLSSIGHTALLHSLAKAGRPGKALQWLQDSVPPQLLTSNMLRNLVQLLLQQGNVAAAEQALRWAAGRMQQPEQQGDVTGSADADAAGQEQQQHLLRDDLQVLPCMRLAVAAAKGTLGAVQAEWDAIQQEQQRQFQQRLGQQQGHECSPHLLSVPVWCSYVSALGRVGKKDPGAVHSLMQEAVEQLADVYHTSAWTTWAKKAARLQHQQQQDCPQQEWQLQEAQQQSLQAWQQLKQLDELDWQNLQPAAVLPQQVAHAVRTENRDVLRSALNAALHLACSQLDQAWVQRLLQLSALLKVGPREWGFDSLLNLRMWQGAPPEALEVRRQLTYVPCSVSNSLLP